MAAMVDRYRNLAVDRSVSVTLSAEEEEKVAATFSKLDKNGVRVHPIYLSEILILIFRLHSPWP